MKQMCIRFLDGQEGGLDRVEIEVAIPAYPLREVWNLLLQEQVEIRDAQLSVAGNYLKLKLAVREQDGSVLTASRRLEIQSTLIGALAPIGPARRTRRALRTRAAAVA